MVGWLIDMGFPETREQVLDQLRHSTGHKRTICEIFREICDLLYEKAPMGELEDKIMEGYLLGKKMDALLREYKGDWDVGLVGGNDDFVSDRARRIAR
jgi:hypothetical protein